MGSHGDLLFLLQGPCSSYAQWFCYHLICLGFHTNYNLANYSCGGEKFLKLEFGISRVSPKWLTLFYDFSFFFLLIFLSSKISLLQPQSSKYSRQFLGDSFISFFRHGSCPQSSWVFALLFLTQCFKLTCWDKWHRWCPSWCHFCWVPSCLNLP